MSGCRGQGKRRTPPNPIFRCTPAPSPPLSCSDFADPSLVHSGWPIQFERNRLPAPQNNMVSKVYAHMMIITTLHTVCGQERCVPLPPQINCAPPPPAPVWDLFLQSHPPAAPGRPMQSVGELSLSPLQYGEQVEGSHGGAWAILKEPCAHMRVAHVHRLLVTTHVVA